MSTLPSPHTQHDPQEMTRAKRRVALHSMLAATAMTVLKLAAGIFSGSLGVLSDAAHSGLDLIGAALTFFSVQVSDKPADATHTYGHAKFESLSAFVEAGIMAISCAWIIWEALARIVRKEVVLHHSLWPVLVLLLSIAVDWWRSRQLRAVAEEYDSPALKADAFHFASDIWSTLAVLAGLLLSYLGEVFHIGWLNYADPAAAVLISLLILRLTWKLTRETSDVLLDAMPYEVRHNISREVRKVEGVLAVEQVRIRRAGSAAFADLTVALPRTYTFEHTNDLVRDVTTAVQQVVPGADVVVHTVPRESATESIFDRVRAVAARRNVFVHEVSVRAIESGEDSGLLRVEQHVELAESMTLAAAHSFVTDMEAEILQAVPEVKAVLTHIESEPATIERAELLNERREQEAKHITESFRAAATHFPEILDVHEIMIGRSSDHLQLSCHCTLPDELTMHCVHEVITGLEDRFKLECPQVTKVLIHPEPETDNHR